MLSSLASGAGSRERAHGRARPRIPHEDARGPEPPFRLRISNDFAFRDDDIVIATYAKSGTTWVQQILAQLVFQGADGVRVAEISPWFDLCIPPREQKLAAVEAQTHRRFLKTHLPNAMLLHFARLRADLAGEVRRIADFLGIEVDPAGWPGILEHCSFDYMKASAAAVAPLGGAIWEGGAGTFIQKRANGRWRDALDADRIAAYEARAEAELGPDCARWLATGEGA